MPSRAEVSPEWPWEPPPLDHETVHGSATDVLLDRHDAAEEDARLSRLAAFKASFPTGFASPPVSRPAPVRRPSDRAAARSRKRSSPRSSTA